MRFIFFLILLSPCVHAQSLLSAKTKIVGGEDAMVGEFPFIVSIQDKDGHFCGGSLIRSDWVLTAAHCLSDPSPIARIVIGLHDQRDDSQAEIKSAKKVIVHPKFSEGTIDWDFALVQLSSESRYPTIDLNTKEFKIRKGDEFMTTVAGWGVMHEKDDVPPDILQKVDLPLISQNMCKKIFPDQITDRMLCAGVDRGGKDSCQGDSGGPMIYNDDGHLVLAGVVSWGEGCARAHKFGVYGKVSAAVEWIEKTIQSSELSVISEK